MPDDGDDPACPRAVLVELRIAPPRATLVLQGELDLHVLDQLRAALGALRGEAVDHLTVDLGPVEFASLAALAELVDAARELAGRGGRTVLVGVRPLHRHVLGLLDLPEGVVVVEPAPG